MSQPVLTLS